MRRLRVHSGPWTRSLLRLDPTVLRSMPAILVLIAAGPTAWAFELGAVLHGQAQVRNWSATWVGLDRPRRLGGPQHVGAAGWGAA